MKISLQKIGKIVQGVVLGDNDHMLSGVSSFEHAQKDQITFADDPKFLKRLNTSKAGAILISNQNIKTSKNIIKVKNPRLALARLIKIFNPEKRGFSGISSLSSISNTACIEPSAHIGAFVYLARKTKIGENSEIYPGTIIEDNVTIGDNVTIYSNVTIGKNCKIGNKVIIHPGTVIGSDGFGFTNDENKYYKIPHIGIVQIDNHVEIGACNTIDRGTIGKTWIKNGVKTDNLVHIGHNVIVGENTLIVSNVAIAGSTVIGKNAVLAGKAGLGGHLKIGDRVKIGPKSGVVRDIPNDKTVSGSPAMPHRQWLRLQRTMPIIPTLLKSIKKIEKKIANLEKINSQSANASRSGEDNDS